MGFAMEAKLERKIGGGAHTPAPQPWDWGLVHPHAPKFPSLVWDWVGAQKCFILRDQTTGDLTSHHLQAKATLTAMPVPQRPHFLSAEL